MFYIDDIDLQASMNFLLFIKHLSAYFGYEVGFSSSEFHRIKLIAVNHLQWLGFESSHYGNSFLNDSSHVQFVALDNVLELRFLLNAKTCGFGSWLSLVLVHINGFVALDKCLIGFDELLEDAFSFTHIFCI